MNPESAVRYHRNMTRLELAWLLRNWVVALDWVWVLGVCYTTLNSRLVRGKELIGSSSLLPCSVVDRSDRSQRDNVYFFSFSVGSDYYHTITGYSVKDH